MCHNGALRRDNVPAVESVLYVLQKVMAFGLDVAIINEIEWRDTKVSSLFSFFFSFLLLHIAC